MSDVTTVVLAGHRITTGSIVTGTYYLKSVTCLGATTAGHLKFYDGADNTGTLILEVDVPGNSNNINNILIPGPGLLFTAGLYVEMPTGYHVTAFYGK
jgi:hypothetical protein